jgi:UDP-N-acetylglucosamine acyltransferase
MANIHPTAIVDPGAELADDVTVGPGCIIESDVKIGPCTVLQEHVIVRRYTTLGANNNVDAFTVLGGWPQDLKFDPNTVSYLRIGDGNVFREHVTISRATGEGTATVVGTHSHAGHNATVGDEAILVNGSALAGHSELGAKAILSAHAAIHQFTWVGTMVMSQGNSIITMHIPPYTLTAGVNRVVGLNSIGLRRSPQISPEDRRQIKDAFVLTYRSGLSPAKALEKMDVCADWGAAADKFRQFVRRVVTAQKPHNRGLAPLRRRSGGEAEE